MSELLKEVGKVLLKVGEAGRCGEFCELNDAYEAALSQLEAGKPAGHVAIAHDGFSGDIIGHYTTKEGKRGVVVQQDGTRVVHVYGEKWLSVLASPPTAPEAEPVIVPGHCSGTALVFEGGCLHVKKDGSGYIVVDEDDFILEDDRCEGEYGPEGSVHWIARFPAGEMSALRDFLNGQRFSTTPTPAVDADAVIEAKLQSLAADILALKLHPATSEEYDAGYIAARNDAFAIIQEAADSLPPSADKGE